VSVLLVTLASIHLLNQPAHQHVSLVRMTTVQPVVQLPPLDNVLHVLMVITLTTLINV